MVVFEYDRTVPNECAAQVCFGTCIRDAFQMPRRFDKTVHSKGKHHRKIFLVVRKRTIFDRQMPDGDLARLCELCGPRAIQRPTVIIFHLRRVRHTPNKAMRYLKNVKNNTLRCHSVATPSGMGVACPH